MKNFYLKLFVFTAFLFATVHATSQVAPVWVRDINTLPDSAFLFPVRVANDANNNVYVLSTYQKIISPLQTLFKIYLKKYDASGGLLWSLVYDNNGSGQPRGFDMAVDNGGNCYIAGGLMETSSYKPLLLKVYSGGGVAWQRDSTIDFKISNYDQIIIKNNLVYVKATYGIATFDLNGTEQWSHGMAIERMAVDNKGQVIFSAYLGNPTSIFRFDTLGVVNFSDSAIVAKRIAVDLDDNFYLLTDIPQYTLVKYDSSGNFIWSKNNFPAPPGFGDIGFDVLTDYNNDVLVVGLSDTMFKFDGAGNMLWEKPMNGLDSYLSSAKITFNNFLAIAGSVYDTTGYDMKVAIYNLNGNEIWWGFYNANPVTQEYTVDLAIDNSGVYAVENNNNNTTLVKFDSFFSVPVDYSLVCVDSVWYDAGNPNFINVTLFNGNINNLNYPSVQIVSPAGDTVGNPNNTVNYFAHIGNIYLTYHDTITDPGIVDFSNYTFLVSEGFGDTTVVITWCTSTGIHESAMDENICIYPNPASDFIIIENNSLHKPFRIQLFNNLGMLVYDVTSSNQKNMVDISAFATGIYFVRVVDGVGVKGWKFVKE